MAAREAAGLYPYILPALLGKPFGLTVDNASFGHHALVTAIFWWGVGIILAAVYFVFAYRLYFRAGQAPNVGGA